MREVYEQEIRAYLLGRLEKNHTSGMLSTPLEVRLPTRRITDWWIFEGRRYPGLDGPLALEWPRVMRQIQRLRQTYNPRWRSVQAPEGEVDWVGTALATATSRTPEFVCRASRVGLTRDENSALLGWCAWISGRWTSYRKKLAPPAGSISELPWMGDREPVSELQLHRWALTAQRSRWPFLRNVVGQSIRVILEPSELDRFPLPQESSTLFELVCLVRVLRTLAPHPTVMRWLDHEASGNEVALDGVQCWYQHSFDRELVLSTGEYDEPLKAATARHGLRVHRDVDLLIQFNSPRSGFSGIILEAKSGQQSYNDAVAQLKHYRAAIRRHRGGRWLLWGVVEIEEANSVTEAALTELAPELQGTDDVWFFSSAGAIPAVLRRIGLADQDPPS